MKRKIFLVFLFLCILVFFSMFISKTFLKADIDENGSKVRYFYSNADYEVALDKSFHKRYKINNNRYAYLKNLKNGDGFVMSNLHGCSQTTIYAPSKAFIIHHTCITNKDEFRSILRRGLNNFNKNEKKISIEFLFQDDYTEEKEQYIKIIKEEIATHFKRNIMI